MASTTRPQGGIAVFSGGTAANFLVDVFDQITTRRKCPLRYIIPISDNGGSSSELIRVFGGPSVGDVRSRLVRLIPNHDGDEERTAIKVLFEHRLSGDPMQARTEWLDIVEARHLLWTFISSPKRELIRSVFNTLNLEIVKRNRPTSVFNFAEASVGNLFLTGARLFSGSFESAIYLLSLICAIPESTAVLPAINSNFTHHISAGLVDGSVLAGQVAISHPSGPTAVPDATFHPTGNKHLDLDRVEDANLPGSLPVLRGHHAFSKDDEEDLPARIDRVWYINPYGHEIWPVANPKVLAALEDSDVVVYSIGSLYTSIIPSVILRGVGQAVARARRKVLILNSKVDRETGPVAAPMSAVDFVRAVAKAAKESQTDFGPLADGEVGRYVSHLVYLEGAEKGGANGAGSSSSLMPRVDVEELRSLGIECVKVKGKMVGEGRKRIVRYEEGELVEALEGIIV
ncbi:UPF0052-domain-containing protein [Cryphonectria parasitica EP155]|uniref:UPF0052-domain-containing protein n=1 Tax=Cryphonectria parasitica (strain ATCC 38755 / EP155) TaxID=660469 RepID=A0A9P5CI75_CRYP1|nr:UPF0052-domain-containing protein [Cryphonectria parasitica EP155]KAF3760564.1 UPF0052-domain-containing protein [Cryphonectria parasitica EP155]